MLARVDGTVALSSSLRAVPAEVTLARAKTMARGLGITRVTDITRLDRLGIPVFASIRPAARPGSLCVNAGKGLRPIEAEVGAYMEAIEYAFAEPGAAPNVEPVEATARDVLDGRTRPTAILDRCPKMGRTIRLDTRMTCVSAEEIRSGRRALLPAELVFLPFAPRGRSSLAFGSSSNGLASGNTVREATLHGLCELLERDIRSFQALRDTSVRIALDSIEGPAAELVRSVGEAGLELSVRTAPNVFGLPYFTAVLFDPQATSPHLVNAGFGCHPHRGVALVRAIAEAAQSRLSFIHGGRDDLLSRHRRVARWSFDKRRAHVRRVAAQEASGSIVPLEEVRDFAATAPSVERLEALVLRRLRAAGLRGVYRVTLTRPEHPLQVVRVVVPRMEVFTESLGRVGPRLAQAGHRAKRA